MFRVLLLVVLLAPGCAATPELDVSRDERVALAELKTFYIRPNPSRSSTSPAALATAKREIERAIQDTLVAKGYRRVIDGQADFEIDYVMYTSERYQQHDGHDQYFFDDRIRLLSGAQSSAADPVRIGTLHVHFYYQGKPFFEAIASDTIGPATAIEKRVRAVVPRLLADLPLSCCP